MIVEFGRWMRRAGFGLALGGTLIASGPGGCSSPAVTGSLQVRSLGDRPALLATDFRAAVFAHDPHAETSFWLSDVPARDLLDGRIGQGQIVHIELLWVPKAGSTPMDSSATNASIRYVVIAGGEVGIYVGAGFVQPLGPLDRPSVAISVRDASLRLAEATAGFRDVLGPAQLSGRFSSRRDPEQARRLFVSVSQFVTDALGESRYVRQGPPAHNDRIVLGPGAGLGPS